MRRNYKEKFNKLHNCHVNCKKPDTNDCVLYPMIREFISRSDACRKVPSIKVTRQHVRTLDLE